MKLVICVISRQSFKIKSVIFLKALPFKLISGSHQTGYTILNKDIKKFAECNNIFLEYKLISMIFGIKLTAFRSHSILIYRIPDRRRCYL